MIKDQWASHPSTDDREAHLNRLNIRTAPMNISAWTIFSNAENLQREMTTMIYHQANFSAPPEVLTNEKFKEKYYNEVNRYHLDSRYKGYFNNKEIKPFDLDSQFGVQSDDTFEGVLSDEVALLPLKIDGLESDIQGLEQIVNKNIPVKTFDYDGQRYARSEAKGIQTRLKAELDHRMKQLEEADQKLYGFFLKEAGKKGVAEKLKSDYKNLFEVIRIGDEDWKQYADIVEIMNPIYEGRVAFETVNAIMNQVSRRERDLKTRMKEMLSDPSYNQYIDDEMRKNMERHVSWERAHFTGDAFDEESLGVLNQALGDYREIILNKNHLVKKELLDWQLTLLN
jgi:hypothetical protein